MTIHSKHNLPCKCFAVTYQEKKCYKTLGYAQMVTPWSLFSNLTTSQSLWAGYEAVTKGLGGNMWGGFENGVHSGSQNGGLLIVRYALYLAKTSKLDILQIIPIINLINREYLFNGSGGGNRVIYSHKQEGPADHVPNEKIINLLSLE